MLTTGLVSPLFYCMQRGSVRFHTPCLKLLSLRVEYPMASFARMVWGSAGALQELTRAQSSRRYHRAYSHASGALEALQGDMQTLLQDQAL